MTNSCSSGCPIASPIAGHDITRYYWSILLLLALSVVLSGCTALGKPTEATDSNVQAQGFDALIAAGDEAYAKTDLDTAQVKYALAVNQRPADVAALYKLGTVHYQKKSFDVAQEVLLRVVAAKNHPVLNYKAGALERLGLIAVSQENLDLAATRFRKALQQQPGRWRSLNGLGIVADMQSRHETAQSYFRDALAAVPDSAQVENNLGYSHYLQGNYSEAQRHFLTATRRNPDYEKAWSNLGLSLVRQSRYEEARSVFAKLAKTHVVSNNLGYLGMLQGDYEMARSELNASQRQAPSYYGVASENLELLQQRARQQTDFENLLPSPGVNTPATNRPTAHANPIADQAALVIVPASTQSTAVPTQPPTQATVTKPVAVRKQAKPKTISASIPRQLVFLEYLESVTGHSSSPSSIQQAIRSVQVNHNLALTGRNDFATRKVIEKLVIERLQTFLSLLGFASTDKAGEYGKGTQQAVRLYKSEQSLAGGALVTEELLIVLGEKFG